jgi:hypothetical protein
MCGHLDDEIIQYLRNVLLSPSGGIGVDMLSFGDHIVNDIQVPFLLLGGLIRAWVSLLGSCGFATENHASGWRIVGTLARAVWHVG